MPEHPSHDVTIAPGSRLGEALGDRTTVNSYHHQSIADLGDGLVATARAPDGVIEAIELEDAGALCLGVQWEEQEQPGTPLFALLARAAAERAESRSSGAEDGTGRSILTPSGAPARRASG
jgi:putative glutamine amidotransferase